MDINIAEIAETVSSFVNSIFLPLLGVFLFYDIRKRKEEAQARKAEAENITTYAEEWKELYEKKEAKVHEQDAKIDQLYAEKNEDRKRMRELMEKNTALSLENQKLKSQFETKRCDVRGCVKRDPPSDY